MKWDSLSPERIHLRLGKGCQLFVTQQPIFTLLRSSRLSSAMHLGLCYPPNTILCDALCAFLYFVCCVFISILTTV